MPRVVSGKSGGIILKTPAGLGTRPTADRVKEAVFSIITNRTADAKFLDLFSGSGQIGIEALSRGARKAVFVEQTKECIKCISDNLEKTKLNTNAIVIMADIKSGIIKAKPYGPFDLVYMDPPFDNAIKSFKQSVILLKEHGLLAENSLLMLEHSATDTPEDLVMNLKLKKSCKYGAIMVSFYDIEAEK